MADPEFGEWLANDLVANLDHMLAESPVKAVKGQKTVEVKSLWANKGQVYSRLLASGITPDFVMAAGDDVTDEDLFARLPDSAWTIHVGRNESRAKYYLSNPEEMVALLAQLVEPADTATTENPNLLTSSNHVLTAEVA
jgi:trehalose 6-phosphate synthase/phosphatase